MLSKKFYLLLLPMCRKQRTELITGLLLFLFAISAVCRRDLVENEYFLLGSGFGGSIVLGNVDTIVPNIVHHLFLVVVSLVLLLLLGRAWKAEP
jgi:hypothetical protein